MKNIVLTHFLDRCSVIAYRIFLSIYYHVQKLVLQLKKKIKNSLKKDVKIKISINFRILFMFYEQHLGKCYFELKISCFYEKGNTF